MFVRTCLSALALLLFSATSVPAVDPDDMAELKARTDVEEKSRSLSFLIATANACGFRRSIPFKDVTTLRTAYAQMDMEAYLKGSAEGAVRIRGRGFSKGSANCQSAIPVLQRGFSGVAGVAEALRELGFE